MPRDEQKETKQFYDEMKKGVMDQLRRTFRPEFLNRVDASIIFRALTREEIKQIVDLEIKKVSERLIEHAISLDVTEAAREWLAVKGYDPDFGARPLRRLIQNEVEDAMSDGILGGKFKLGSEIRVNVGEDGELLLEPVEEAAPEEPVN
ncbi:MAG: ATP-dependent Clp protease ATP-binding subunit, partial [Anaerolineae bacterium]|nr:ATP-dependent Clp protease ATP-binding subunit [Anaerolineae bacterium]